MTLTQRRWTTFQSFLNLFSTSFDCNSTLNGSNCNKVDNNTLWFTELDCSGKETSSSSTSKVDLISDSVRAPIDQDSGTVSNNFGKEMMKGQNLSIGFDSRGVEDEEEECRRYWSARCSEVNWVEVSDVMKCCG